MNKLFKRFAALSLTLVFMGLNLGGAVMATASVAKGYVASDTDIKPGMAVSLSADSNDSVQKVEKASTINRDKYLGIVTSIDQSVVTITDKQATVHVANTGQYDVLVSDINGEVKKGDFMVVSPVKGLLMKRSDVNQNDVSVAVALKDFSEASDISTSTVTTDTGTNREIRIGKLSAEISTKTIFNNESRQFLAVFGESLAGKPVSEVRVLIACILLFVILIAEGSIVYGAVTSSITAIGRNPLSKKSVFKQLAQTSVMALLILVFGAAGIYVVIWT